MLLTDVEALLDEPALAGGVLTTRASLGGWPSLTRDDMFIHTFAPVDALALASPAAAHR